MASYTSEDEKLRDNVIAFNTLVSAARNMVATLATGGPAPISVNTVVPDVANFQRLFSDVRQIVFDELQNMTQGSWQPAPMVLELRSKGLTVDGKYGERTGTALMLVMWAQSGSVDMINKIGAAVPANPAGFPRAYLNAKDLFDQTLREVPAPQGLEQPPPVPAPMPTAQVIEAAQQGGTSVAAPDTSASPTQVMHFEDHTVTGQGKGRFSFGVVLAGLVGILTLGGITYYIVHKKRFA